MASKPKRDDPKQSKRFIEAAKEAGASNSAKEAEKVARDIIKQSPKKAGA